jgi:hypothetical protein
MMVVAAETCRNVASLYKYCLLNRYKCIVLYQSVNYNLVVMNGMSDDVKQTKLKLNSVALVRERTIPTERPPPVGEVSANFCG